MLWGRYADGFAFSFAMRGAVFFPTLFVLGFVFVAFLAMSSSWMVGMTAGVYGFPSALAMMARALLAIG